MAKMDIFICTLVAANYGDQFLLSGTKSPPRVYEQCQGLPSLDEQFLGSLSVTFAYRLTAAMAQPQDMNIVRIWCPTSHFSSLQILGYMPPPFGITQRMGPTNMPRSIGKMHPDLHTMPRKSEDLVFSIPQGDTTCLILQRRSDEHSIVPMLGESNNSPDPRCELCCGLHPKTQAGPKFPVMDGRYARDGPSPLLWSMSRLTSQPSCRTSPDKAGTVEMRSVSPVASPAPEHGDNDLAVVAEGPSVRNIFDILCNIFNTNAERSPEIEAGSSTQMKNEEDNNAELPLSHQNTGVSLPKSRRITAFELSRLDHKNIPKSLELRYRKIYNFDLDIRSYVHRTDDPLCYPSLKPPADWNAPHDSRSGTMTGYKLFYINLVKASTVDENDKEEGVVAWEYIPTAARWKRVYGGDSYAIGSAKMALSLDAKGATLIKDLKKKRKAGRGEMGGDV
ncbi:hypothetical protein EV421DRAFT_1744167 [Armillaria borealis]|uniref:Uncharacterized protein n=1 Tax=Armillaria borealis TaxID=47425 RepID=A0AA39IUY6_9AGAR|nr:hypothetical protein EV421DRAFT_1744167 [Armillaria borealis]